MEGTVKSASERDFGPILAMAEEEECTAPKNQLYLANILRQND
jgi:hypothetical protein